MAPRRDNILARIDGTSGDAASPIVVFDVHQDTVPVEGMTIDPWNPTIDQGRVFGRGACDVKGAMACMLTAFARLAAERPPGMPTLILACTVNEENGFTGARRWPSAGPTGPSPFFARPPDQVIVAEPTDLHVVVAHKGVVRWRCHADGRAAHSSSPDLGENAIYHMGHALVQLQRYAAELKQGSLRPAAGAPDDQRRHHPRRDLRQCRARFLHDRSGSPPASRRRSRWRPANTCWTGWRNRSPVPIDYDTTRRFS